MKNIKNIIILLQFTCILLLVVFRWTGKNDIPPISKEPPQIIIKDILKDALTLLKSDNADESDKGYRQLLEINMAILTESYNIVTNEEVTYCFEFDAKPAKRNALKLLGDFRYQANTEGLVELLYGNLLYGISMDGSEVGVPDTLPPAVESLIAIGKPSTDFLLDRWRDEFGLVNANFGKISYRLPTQTQRGPSDDSKNNSVDSIYNKDTFPDVFALFGLIITTVYPDPQEKYFVQDVLDRYPDEKDRENVIKNLKKMLLHD